MRLAVNTLFLISILSFFNCKQNTEFSNYNIEKQVFADSAMVVTAHPVATKVGIEILKKGGNAVDAAIAVQFALAVCYPGAGNIGGGGLMVYRNNKGQSVTLDFREKAPLAAHKDMYLKSNGEADNEKSHLGHLSVGVPGSVDGMVKAFEKFSILKDWKTLLQPAINIADKGFELTEREANNLNESAADFDRINGRKTNFTNQKWKKGDVFKQKELTKTLAAIRDHGRDGFYKGWVAEALIKEVKSGGGIITQDDLDQYSAVWRPAIKTNYKGYKIHGMPPPSSGGIALAQLLKSIEPYNLGSLKHHSADAIHLMVEAERRIYADRATHLGDSDFYEVPKEMLLDSSYNAKRMKNFNALKASPSDSIVAGNISESEETTHFSIVDQYGNAVSLTTTLNDNYGSLVVVDDAGFILNDEMHDFSIKPGVANIYGLIGAEANKIEPGKRMLSSMTPTIIEKDGKLKMIVGTPGGSTIITSVFQTIVNVLDFGMSGKDAVSTPRFHHQWKPNQISIEKNAFTDSVRQELVKRGHLLKERENIGRVEAIIFYEDGRIEGAADPRGDDDAKGF